MLLFTFSIVFNKSYEILTLYYKIGFVFDNFAHLLASGSLLSTFKVGEAKL